MQSHLARPYRQIVMIDNMLADRLKNMTRRDFTREITSFAVETYLMGRLTSVAKTFVKGSKVKILALAEKVAEKAPEAIALTAEGVPIEAQIVKEGTKDLLRVAEKRIVSGVTKAAEGISQIAAKVENLINLNPEIAQLRAMFDGTRKGFAEFTNKTIKMPYAHILGPEFYMTKRGIRFSGFHHDLNQILEKSGIFKFTNKVMGKHGVYEAEVWYNGFKETKTFFPSSWSQKKVMTKVYEAYDNFVASGKNWVLEPTGKYRMDCFTNEGIEIRMYFTKNGKATTIHPILEKI